MGGKQTALCLSCRLKLVLQGFILLINYKVSSTANYQRVLLRVLLGLPRSMHIIAGVEAPHYNFTASFSQGGRAYEFFFFQCCSLELLERLPATVF